MLSVSLTCTSQGLSPFDRRRWNPALASRFPRLMMVVGVKP
jgi:hypothetical protein